MFYKYDFFESNGAYVIYAKVKMDNKSVGWFINLWRIVGKNNNHPHVTIAKGLDKAKFEQLWPHFENKLLRENVLVNELTILEKQLINNARSTRFCEFKFDSVQEQAENDLQIISKNKRAKALLILQTNLF